MGDKTGIQWTDATWNPTNGCSRVSPGCENCYAERFAGRFSAPGQRYEGLVRLGPNGARWTGKMVLTEKMLDQPLRWKRPRRIFVNSMSDLFHESLMDEQIDSVFAVMALAGRHTFQVLTKRADRMREYIASRSLSLNFWEKAARDIGWTLKFDGVGLCQFPLPNVWLGVSVEDQQRADERIPALLQTPAAVRFVSYEPALGPVDFSPWLWPTHWRWDARHKTPEEAVQAGAFAEKGRQALVSAHTCFVDWVIVGGESGPGARPFDLSWANSVVKQCKEAVAACFVKQLGSRVQVCAAHSCAVQPCRDHRVFFTDSKGGDWSEWLDDIKVREFPKTGGHHE